MKVWSSINHSILSGTRLSRRRLIRFLSSLTPSPTSVSKLDQRHTKRLRKRDKLVTGEGGGDGGRSQIILRRESLVLDKSFGTLRIILFEQNAFRLHIFLFCA